MNSGIQWTDHTFNPWIGCTKVSPGCDHCYAETWANRFGTAIWGSGQPRHLTSASSWNLPRKWNREAEQRGIRYRVFCASLADVFDNEVDPAWRERLWGLIRETPHLDWLLLTKRIGNVQKMLPDDWDDEWRDGYPNVWLGITVVNQEEADRDIPKLRRVAASRRFLSIEPLLGSVDLRFPTNREVHEAAAGMNLDRLFFSFNGIEAEAKTGDGIHWVIVGGESGPNARPMHPDWARSLRDQCRDAGAAFHFKQWGEWQVVYDRDVDDPDWSRCPKSTDGSERYLNLAGGHGFHGERVCFIRRVGMKAAGRMLDGREWNELPMLAA